MKKIIQTLIFLFINHWLIAQDFKDYGNYDFVAGEKILLEDNFQTDKEGAVPAHWLLESGKGSIIKQGEEKVFSFLEYYTYLTPIFKQKMYLPKQYTIEFDHYLDAGYDGNPGISVCLRVGGENTVMIETAANQMRCIFPGGILSGDLPADIINEKYYNKWHHFAIAVNEKQMNLYCNQHKILSVPNFNALPNNLMLIGNTSQNMPLLLKNFKLAQGGAVVVNKKFTETKIVTHSINFDYNQATLRPESMGFLKTIIQILQDNPEIKFEVGGHTDGDGDENANLQLSQKRADAVRKQLIKMGIDDKRLTTKGYGKSKPIDVNTTPEGKANNRRVEFVKI